METLPIKIFKRNMFINILLNQDNLGFVNFTFVIGDPTFMYDYNFLTTEINLIGNSIGKYKSIIKDYHFYNECLLKQSHYLENKQEHEQMNEILKRCFDFNHSEKLTNNLSSRAYTIEIKLNNTYFALFRRDEQLIYETQNKFIFFETQHGIGKFQKEYSFDIEDEFIFNEMVEYIKTNESLFTKQ
jgi:sugar diacid utilization regulator